jgi:hypothetical protein
MTGNNRQFQPKPTSELHKGDSAPLIFSPARSRRDEYSVEEELYAEENSQTSLPRRQPTSSLRLNNNASGRRGTGSREVSMDETTRQQNPGTPRRTVDVYNPTTGPIHMRYGRNTSYQSATSPAQVEQKNIHWLLYVGVGMIAALALWVTASSVLAWGIEKYNDVIYGNPRMYQTDYVVNHNHDSPMHPSHFLALNLHGQVIIVELPAGDPTKSIDYIGPSLVAVGDEKIPITLSFSDVNKDRRVDMIVHIQDKVVNFCNNGTKFTACH